MGVDVTCRIGAGIYTDLRISSAVSRRRAAHPYTKKRQGNGKPRVREGRYVKRSRAPGTWLLYL